MSIRPENVDGGDRGVAKRTGFAGEVERPAKGWMVPELRGVERDAAVGLGQGDLRVLCSAGGAKGCVGLLRLPEMCKKEGNSGLAAVGRFCPGRDAWPGGDSMFEEAELGDCEWIRLRKEKGKICRCVRP